MEYFPVTKTEKGFQVEDIPDPVKLIRLDDPKAHRLADLTLHKSDLEFAADCLAAINQAPKEPSVLRDALWRSAIVNYMKCFGDSHARSQLSADKIYKGEPPEALEAFQFFKDLRNKHIVHDENAYAQSIPGAVLNKGDKPYKIEKILCFNARVDVLGQENYSKLKLLIDKAFARVVLDFDGFCDVITQELEKKSYDELLKKDEVVCRVPSIEDMSKNRRSKP